MNKRLSFLAVGALLLGAAFTISAPAQVIASATSIGCCNINPDNYVSITLRSISPSVGNGTFLPLPDTVATVNNGVLIQADKVFVITDVRVSNNTGPANARLELVEANQPQTFERILLQESSMLDGWHSSFGVVVRGDAALAMGLTLRTNVIESFTVDVEITGYARNN